MHITDEMVSKAMRAMWEAYLRNHVAPLQMIPGNISLTTDDMAGMARAALTPALGDVEPLEDVLLALQPGDYDPMKGEA